MPVMAVLRTAYELQSILWMAGPYKKLDIIYTIKGPTKPFDRIHLDQPVVLSVAPMWTYPSWTCDPFGDHQK